VAVAKKVAKKAAAKKAPAKRARAAAAAEAAPLPAARESVPIGLDEVLGQERALGVLEASLRSGRLHHAWIFHGPEGVGKFTAALAFAAVLLDPSSAPDRQGRVRPGPESQAQRLLRAGSHPDLHVVRKELAAVSREDTVRSSKQTTLAKQVVDEFLIEPAERTRVVPGESRAGKVFVVDEAHLLGIEAQNSLLKTIEEPPEGTVIILVTPSEDRLLPTIRSRCQRVPFGPLSEGAMQAWIGRSGMDLGKLDVPWALSFAGGSPGVLKAIVETGLERWHEAVGPAIAELQRGVAVIDLGTVLAKLVDDAAAAAVEGDARASKDVANRVAARRMFRLLGEAFRAQLRRSAAVGRIAEAEWATGCIDLVDQAERQLDSNVALGLVFENLAAQCVAVG
jgi:DNA polymerase-3 subunit delta'